MSNNGWIITSVILVLLIIVIGGIMYKKSKNDAAAINAQKLAILSGGLNSTLTQGYQSSGFGGFIKNVLGSSSVTAFGSGFGSGIGSSLGSGSGSTTTTTKPVVAK